jgi:uridine kinase
MNLFPYHTDFIDEISEIITHIQPSHPVRVAIDGIDGVGKTTLADELVTPIRLRGREVIRGSVDSFHNPRALRYRRGRWSAVGYFNDSFNYDALIECLLAPLGPGGDRQYRTTAFDYREDCPVVSPLRRAAEDAVLVFDGVFLLRPQLIGFWDLTIYLEATFENARRRCAERDGDAYSEEWEARYIEGQRLYLKDCRPATTADIVVDFNDPDHPVIVGSH